MSIFEHPEYDNHEQICFFNDETSGLRAITAIHSTAFGTAGGGCRMVPYETSADALYDVLRLSKAMSYKLALAEVPSGGAKTVVIGDPATDKSPALWKALGKAVESMGGRYIIAEDVGTTPEDMSAIGEVTNYVMGRSVDTGPATGYGVFIGLRTAVEHVLERDDLEGLSVAVQGVGGVGRKLCELLHENGASLVVCDANDEAAQWAVDELGAKKVGLDEIYDQEVDVFSPCALGAILNEETIPRLRCKIVAGGANNQLERPDRDGPKLAERGIAYAPDFVLNAGGVIAAQQEAMRMHSSDADTPVDWDAIFEKTEFVGEILKDVLERAESDDMTTHDAAVALAKEKMANR